MGTVLSDGHHGPETRSPGTITSPCLRTTGVADLDTPAHSHGVRVFRPIDVSIRWTCLLALAGVLGVASASSLEAQRTPKGPERRAILDAVRPLAAARTQQSVRIVVARLKHAGDWAVLEGELVDARGRSLDWARVAECEPELDKRLWATLQRVQGSWHVRQLAVCAPEPPYWDPSFLKQSAVPCDVLAGLTGADGVDLAVTCRRSSRSGTAGVPREADTSTP